jgi:hypothetical protein
MNNSKITFHILWRYKNMKITEITNPHIKLKKISMNRNAPIPGNEGMPIDTYNFSMLVSAPSGGGKTSLVVNLISKGGMLYKKFDRVEIWSPSIHTINQEIKLPPERIHQTLDIDELEAVLEEMRQNKRDGSDEETLFIFDDFLADIQEAKKKVMLKMVLNRAHMGLSLIFTSQSYLKGLEPILRKNMSMIIQIRTMNQKELEAIREEHSNLMPKEFAQLVRHSFKTQYDFLMFKNDGSIYHNFHRLEIEF